MNKEPSKNHVKGRNGGTLYPQQKGKPSKNPNGRPVGTKNFKTVIEDLFALPIDTLEEEIKLRILGINPKIKTLEQAFNARLLLDALSGDSYSKKEIIERLHGKVPDKTEAENYTEIVVRFEK